MSHTSKVPGSTDGVAVGVGFIGEKLTSTAMTASTVTTTAAAYIDVAGASLALTVGEWMVYYSGLLRLRNVSGAIRNSYGRLLLTTAANVIVPGGICYTGNSTWDIGTDFTQHYSFALPITVTSNTTYKLRLQCGDADTATRLYFTVGIAGFDTDDGVPQFFAIRRA
jgi:hypothetical protein